MRNPKITTVSDHSPASDSADRRPSATSPNGASHPSASAETPQVRFRTMWMPSHRDKRLPPNVYSECEHHEHALADLAYLRDEKGDSECWIEKRTVTPWERTDD